MIPTAEVQVHIDKESIQSYIQEQIEKQVHHQQLFMDINMLAKITCMSVRYLEDEFLNDPRIKIHERKKSRKRWWIYQPTIEAIKDIVNNEW